MKKRTVYSGKRVGKRRGFTLVEMLVSIAIFSIVVAIAVGGFVRALRVQRQVAALLLTNSNASLAIEQVAREVRTGWDFCRVSTACTSNSLSFMSRDSNNVPQEVTYRLEGERIERGINNEFQAVTAENVRVRNFAFEFPFNSDKPNDGKQTRVTLLFTISPRGAQVGEIEVHLQTTVSPRTLDLDS